MALDVNHLGFTNYSWAPSTGLNSDAVPNPVAVLSQDIMYTVTATNALGCSATDAIRIKVYKGPDIYVPNAFTPNGDTKNDWLRACRWASASSVPLPSTIVLGKKYSALRIRLLAGMATFMASHRRPALISG